MFVKINADACMTDTKITSLRTKSSSIPESIQRRSEIHADPKVDPEANPGADPGAAAAGEATGVAGQMQWQQEWIQGAHYLSPEG